MSLPYITHIKPGDTFRYRGALFGPDAELDGATLAGTITGTGVNDAVTITRVNDGTPPAVDGAFVEAVVLPAATELWPVGEMLTFDATATWSVEEVASAATQYIKVI